MPLLLPFAASLLAPKGQRSGARAAAMVPPARPADDLPAQTTAAPGSDEPRKLFAGMFPLRAGKYLISPLVKSLENGWYACSVSIRSGSGRGTTDRVLRLTRLFRNGLEAADYARGEGLQWVNSPPSP